MLALWGLACRGAPGAPSTLSERRQVTGLAGVVLRGPILPVCIVGRPCDGPFSASFHVYSGPREIGQFVSDSAGHFSVALAPGGYTVVPDSTAPVFPRFQAKVVMVQPQGETTVTLEFDTGIR
jgi:hypothetical protein